MQHLFTPRNILLSGGALTVAYCYMDPSYYQPMTIRLPPKYMPISRLEKEKLGRMYIPGEHVTRKMFAENGNRLP